MNAVDERKIDFAALERFTRRAMLRHKLTFLEWHVIEFLLEHSYGAGRLGAPVERDAQMAGLAGLTNQQLSRTLKGLVEAHLITIGREQMLKKKGEVRKDVNVTVYKIVQPIGQWGRAWRRAFRSGAGERAAIEQDLQALTGDLQDLLWPEESLADTVTLEQFGCASATTYASGVTPHGRKTPDDCTPPGAASEDPLGRDPQFNPAQDRNALAGGARLAAELQQCLMPAFVCGRCGGRMREEWVNHSLGIETAARFRERHKDEGALRYPGLKHEKDEECLPPTPASLNALTATARERVDESSTFSGPGAVSVSPPPARVDERSTLPPSGPGTPAEGGGKVDESSTNLKKVDERSTAKAGKDQLQGKKVDDSSTFAPKEKGGCTSAPAGVNHDYVNVYDHDYVMKRKGMIKKVLGDYGLANGARSRARELTLEERDFLVSAQQFVGMQAMRDYLGAWHKWLYLGFLEDAVEALGHARMLDDCGQIRTSRGGTLWSVFCSYAYQTITALSGAKVDK